MNILSALHPVIPEVAVGELKVVTERSRVLIDRLQCENEELKLHLSLLIRLLIERGVFSAEDFSALVNETKAKLAVSERAQLKARAAVALKKKKL